MPPINNAPYNPITTPIVTCAICKNEQTIARSANSETLRKWHVVTYPDNCHCPKCHSAQKTPAKPAESTAPEIKKPVTLRKYSNISKYYRVAQKLGEFSTSDLKGLDLPNPARAGSYLWGLVRVGRLINVGKARFKVANKEVTK